MRLVGAERGQAVVRRQEVVVWVVFGHKSQQVRQIAKVRSSQTRIRPLQSAWPLVYLFEFFHPQVSSLWLGPGDCIVLLEHHQLWRVH